MHSWHRRKIYSSLKSSNAAAGVKTSSRPMTCRDKGKRSTPASARPSVRV